ncbi:MAG: Sec-independent protein translocase protein TatB [bacterium]|jgi:sec-independent protein translocase protein TatB|nr:Sec-independent protein translocase protein TatB [Betaproteobacteria bacterium]
MLDLGFSEMMLIAVVALVVLGPERLPKVARTVGHLVGRMQRYVADVKSDITREMELEELRKFRQTVEDTASSMQSSFNAFETDARSTAGDLEAMARGEARGDPVPGASAQTGMPLPGDEVSPVPLPESQSFERAPAPADAWVEPTVAGAMSSLACSARYTATASLAMGSAAAPLSGAQRWPELPAAAPVPATDVPAMPPPSVVGMPVPVDAAVRAREA